MDMAWHACAQDAITHVDISLRGACPLLAESRHKGAVGVGWTSRMKETSANSPDQVVQELVALFPTRVIVGGGACRCHFGPGGVGPLNVTTMFSSPSPRWPSSDSVFGQAVVFSYGNRTCARARSVPPQIVVPMSRQKLSIFCLFLLGTHCSQFNGRTWSMYWRSRYEENICRR